MRRSLLSLALSCAVLLCSFSSFADGKNNPLQAFIEREKAQQEFVPVSGLWQQSDRFPVSATEAYVSDAKVLEIDPVQLSKLATEKPQAITLTVANPKGGAYEIELARFDFLSKDFQIQETGANGAKNMVNYTPGAYYRGVVKGVEGSMAAFCFFNNEAYGVYSTPDAGNTVLTPNTLAGAPANTYLLYNDRDMKIRPLGKCATDDLPPLTKTKAQNKNVYSTCKDVEVYFLADYDTYITFNQNTTTLANYITSVFNVTTALYRNEGIYVSIKFMEVIISYPDDPYKYLPDNSPDFLTTFANTLTDMHDADMAMLFSTRYGDMGGIAYLDQLCSNAPLSFANIDNLAPGNFPTYTWNTHMITHEFGHTLGSPHTHSCSWNGNGTAIDACVPTQGSCPDPIPAVPSGGGTIMSYCHFQSTGINFSKGFGTQPGNVIRNRVNNAWCADIRVVTQPTNGSNKLILANRECTDADNITWYWNDNNNTNETDDVLVLKIRKANNNIGNLDAVGFEVKAGTGIKYNTNAGDILNVPVGTPLKGTNVSMTRYWNVKTNTQPTGEVEIMFPFMAPDMNDIDGSAPNATPLTFADLMVYMTMNGKDGNPAVGLQGTTANDIKTYTNAISSSTNTWSAEKYGDTVLAKFNTTQLNGGGSIVYSYSVDPTIVQNIFTSDKATFYPNPTNNSWNVWVPKSGDNIRFVLYTVDGRIVKEQTLQGNAVNEIDATTLAAGLYYYRISSETATYTGNLQKN